MKIDIASKQSLVAESASKKQQENAKILFGSKGVSILSKLEDYSKEKQLHTKGIDYLISALKTKDTAALEKYASSAAGKKMVANVKKLASAKTFSAIMANIKSIKPNATLQKLSGATVTPSMRTQKPGSAPVKVGAVAGLVAKKLSPKYQKVLEASIGKGLTFNQESVKETLRAIVIADQTNSKISDVYEYLDGDDSVSLTDSRGNDASPADVKPLRAMLTNGSRTSVEKGLTKLMTDTGLTQNRAKSILFDLENYDPYAQVVAALILNDSSPSLIKVFDKGLVNSVKKLLVTLREEGIINSPRRRPASSKQRGSASEEDTIKLLSTVFGTGNVSYHNSREAERYTWKVNIDGDSPYVILPKPGASKGLKGIYVAGNKFNFTPAGIKKATAFVESLKGNSVSLKSGVTLSSEYANALPANILKMVDSVVNPTLGRKIMNEAEEGAGSSVKGLGYAKIKKLIDALPATMKEEDNLPDWVSAEEEGSVTAEDVGGSGEILGYYSPISRSAEFRLVVNKPGFREPGIVSIWS